MTMEPKRSKRDTDAPQCNPTASLWSWVGTEVLQPHGITQDHRLRACGLSTNALRSSCPNKYAPRPKTDRGQAAPDLEEDDDVIVVDEHPFPCTRKTCRLSPTCLNYLGQEQWESDERCKKLFLKHAEIGEDPSERRRKEGCPVGLKNLGATCYANAYLQVWYQIIPFRRAVYACQFPTHENFQLEPSPTYQLQVTFAALQNGVQSVFNPVKFVESLQLRAGEQQDAQEFSKLFMSHLQAEFQKQTQPELRSLINDQFEGRLAYVTTCHGCQNRMERQSEFLELELNLEADTTLADCIRTFLAEEILSDDNKYFCSHCNAPQVAGRCLSLKKLPPVLHFSLLRFVYDITTMSRKKSKHTIIFPEVLDMSPFVSQEDGQGSESHIYDLRGILLHKGPSAYHGHYEAQIYDVGQRRWFQFDDEVVSEIETLGEPKKELKATKANNSDAPSRSTPQRAPKRRKIVLSEDEDTSKPEVLCSPKKGKGKGIHSKNAYMLVYARREASQSPEQTKDNLPAVSGVASAVVGKANQDFMEQCTQYTACAEQKRLDFENFRSKLRNVYSSWDVRELSDATVLSREALEKWLIEDSVASFFPSTSPVDGGSTSSSSRVIPNRVACPHDGLDPLSRSSMKLVGKDALTAMESLTGCVFEPKIRPSDACHLCIEAEFTERLYAKQHPEDVKRFDNLEDVDDSFWISKRWLRDWRTATPKMHTPSQNDPSPGSQEFGAHVRCEHGGLSLNKSLRKSISRAGTELLQTLFPDWDPLPCTRGECPRCYDKQLLSKDDAVKLRKQAEEEKNLLAQLYTSLIEDRNLVTEAYDYAILPGDFTRAWRQWLFRPADNPRPVSIETEILFCEHGQLNFDPNSPIDMNGPITVVKSSDWDILARRYRAGPAINLRAVSGNDGSHAFTHETPTCVDCRLRLKTDFTETSLTVMYHGTVPNDRSIMQKPAPRPRQTIVRPSGSTRRSKRILDSSNAAEQKKVKVTKESTVKDLKLLVDNAFNIPTIHQALFYNGKELENAETVATLNLLASDIVDLWRYPEEINSDDEEQENRAQEGPGFTGTLLSSQNTIRDSEIPCAACTLLNPVDARICQVCETPIALPS